MVAPVSHPTTFLVHPGMNVDATDGTSTSTSSRRRRAGPSADADADADARGRPSTSLPLVLLLDLDGTLIGRVNMLIAEYDLHREVARAEGAGAAAAAAAAGRALRESFVTRLKHGLLRPGVRRFVRRVEQLRAEGGATTPIELFVYTASDDPWARFIIPCVEAAIGARFNRPLFMRSHCLVRTGTNELRKSVAALLPRLLRSLRPRYPLLLSQAELAERVVLVDNTPGVLADPREQARLLICPTYEYNPVFDVLGRLPPGAILTRPALVAVVLARHGIGRQVGTASASARGAGPVAMLSAYYQWLSTALSRTQRPNELAQRNDVFWEALRRHVSALARRTHRATLPAHAVAALQHAAAVAAASTAPTGAPMGAAA